MDTSDNNQTPTPAKDSDHLGPQPDSPAPPGQTASEPGNDEAATGRAKVLWDVLVFQLKLLMDGLRDVILSPISIGAALLGIVAGGDQPNQYLLRVMKFGRRSEIWINLFNYRRGSATDEMLKPLEEKIFNEIRSDSWVGRVNSSLNETIDDTFDGRKKDKTNRE